MNPLNEGKQRRHVNLSLCDWGEGTGIPKLSQIPFLAAFSGVSALRLL